MLSPNQFKNLLGILHHHTIDASLFDTRSMYLNLYDTTAFAHQMSYLILTSRKTGFGSDMLQTYKYCR